MSKWGIITILLFTLFYEIPITYAQTETVVVDAPSLNIRTGPGLTYEVLGSLKKGAQVEVVSTSDDWLEIQYGDGSGWIASWLTTSENPTEQTNSIIVSQVNALNVRSEPSSDSAVLGRMNAGDEALMTGRNGEWASVNASGVEGWVHTDYITESSVKTQPVVDEKKDNGIIEVNAVPEKILAPNSFTVSVNALNVRKKADLSSKRIGMINQGETYEVKEIAGNWIRISLDKKKDGWVYSFHGVLSSNDKTSSNAKGSGTVTILTNGTNIRQSPTTSSEMVMLADAGEKFPIIKEEDDWYEISLPTGESAYVAEWVVSVDDGNNFVETFNEKKVARVPGTLKGLTLVVDPGHGGNDHGTTGARGTDEKGLTLKTAELLAAKLKAAGAEVILTREADTYVSLRKRVAISNQHNADAFISVHYDANPDASITGFTTYYTYAAQKELASAINDGLASTVNLRNRGAQPGDFLVLRENKQNAILIELGFLSNATEERAMSTELFREQATHGIYKGLLEYFNTN